MLMSLWQWHLLASQSREVVDYTQKTYFYSDKLQLSSHTPPTYFFENSISNMVREDKHLCSYFFYFRDIYFISSSENPNKDSLFFVPLTAYQCIIFFQAIIGYCVLAIICYKMYQKENAARYHSFIYIFLSIFLFSHTFVSSFWLLNFSLYQFCLTKRK